MRFWVMWNVEGVICDVARRADVLMRARDLTHLDRENDHFLFQHASMVLCYIHHLLMEHLFCLLAQILNVVMIHSFMIRAGGIQIQLYTFNDSLALVWHGVMIWRARCTYDLSDVKSTINIDKYLIERFCYLSVIKSYCKIKCCNKNCPLKWPQLPRK